MSEQFDMVIVGSGIAGSISALVLSRLGLSVLVVERKNHPRFVIGESTVPLTTLLMRHLAKTYDVPEIAEVFHYLGLRAHHCAAWPKQHFWFGLHREGALLDREHEALVETLMLPFGPDVHMLRSDVDAFLVSHLERYGVTYLDRTDVVSVSGDAIVLRDARGERQVRARWIIDASGHASFLAKQLGMRDAEPKLETDTRSIFGHFEGALDLDSVLGGCNPAFRYRRSGGTMHHCFHGGWMWVIPFDNGVTSVGVQLDRRIHPLDASITPEDELRSIVRRHPTIEAQLGAMRPVFPPIRTDRVQFTSNRLVGDGFVLTPHAAAFVDPLFSTGIMLTSAFLVRFARAAKDRDFRAERFRFLEPVFLAELQHIDRIVDTVIRSFRDIDLFRACWRLWTIALFGQWSAAVLQGDRVGEGGPLLYGSGFDGFAKHVRAMHALVSEDGDPKAIARTVDEQTAPWWERICGSFFRRDDTTSLSLRGTDKHGLLEQMRRITSAFPDPTFRLENVEAWLENGRVARADLIQRYRSDKNSNFARAFERILANENPDTLDYAKLIGV